MGNVLSALALLHSKFRLVHADIRLYNVLPYAGKIIDFDLSREVGSAYPPGLVHLHLDGERHPDVAAAIDEDTVGELGVQFEHDFFSMAAVLGMYTLHNGGPPLSYEWENVVRCVEEGNLETAARDCASSRMRGMQLLLTESARNSLKIATRVGTGSPPQARRTYVAPSTPTNRRAKRPRPSTDDDEADSDADEVAKKARSLDHDPSASGVASMNT
jgi:hypothetical protein